MPLTNNQRAREEQYTYGYPADPYYVVLPPAPIDPWKRRRQLLGYGSLIICVALLVVAAVYFLWPSQVQIQVARFQLNQFGYNIVPQPGSFVPLLFLNFSMDMMVQVNNRDFYGVDYDSVNVEIGYRGRSIGSVSSENGRLSARQTTYVNATLDLDGAEVVHDVGYLLKDIEKGEVPLDTVTEFDGRIKVWFFNIGLKKAASCGVVVIPSNKTIISQDCELE